MHGLHGARDGTTAPRNFLFLPGNQCSFAVRRASRVELTFYGIIRNETTLKTFSMANKSDTSEIRETIRAVIIFRFSHSSSTEALSGNCERETWTEKMEMKDNKTSAHYRLRTRPSEVVQYMCDRIQSLLNIFCDLLRCSFIVQPICWTGKK